MNQPAAPPLDVTSLVSRISDEFDGLSKQLKVIARYVEQHQDHLALERIQDVAERCGVQPSAVVRFAKHFGFSGYSEMQQIFREVVAQQISSGRNYQARIRDVIDQGHGRLGSADIAYEFIVGSIAGMQDLQRDLHGSVFEAAVDLLAQARCIWIMGMRRSFPVASYLAYALQHTDKQIQLLSALGGMHPGQLRGLNSGDVVIAISFAPYAEETVLISQAAASRGAKIIALTDSRMSPLAREASAALLVQESSTYGFRSLTNTMCLAQSLFIALAYRLELDLQPSDPAAAITHPSTTEKP